MKKMIAILLALTCTLPLLAEKIADLEINFPPSVYEWRLLIEEAPFDEDDEDFSIDDKLAVFTHREGDALEVLFTISHKSSSLKDDEVDTEESIQNEINSDLAMIFPNHRICISNFSETETEGFFEWEFNDGVQQIIHGYARDFQAAEKGAVLCYFTTALKTEQNRILWTNTLMNAHL